MTKKLGRSVKEIVERGLRRKREEIIKTDLPFRR